jgi:hypothetical protein
MKALRIHAGPRARQHLQNHGLQPGDVGVIPAAAGGPKGLILGPLDRFIFGEWLPQSSQPVHLVGASIGAWRMATACLQQSVAAFERLEHDYIHQHYDLPPGKKRPTAAHVSERFGQNLQAFYGGRIDEVLNHPRYRLHIVTSRGRHLLGREHRVATPLGYLGAFLTNTVHRKAMGAWLERVVFSSSDAAMADGVGVSVGAACAALPFGTSDYRTRQVLLHGGNFMPALQASCSIPFVLQAVHNIPGAPRGAYWDGGITDYHLHLAYGQQSQNAIELIAGSAYPTSAGGQKPQILARLPRPAWCCTRISSTRWCPAGWTRDSSGATVPPRRWTTWWCCRPAPTGCAPCPTPSCPTATISPTTAPTAPRVPRPGLRLRGPASSWWTSGRRGWRGPT